IVKGATVKRCTRSGAVLSCEQSPLGPPGVMRSHLLPAALFLLNFSPHSHKNTSTTRPFPNGVLVPGTSLFENGIDMLPRTATACRTTSVRLAIVPPAVSTQSPTVRSSQDGAGSGLGLHTDRVALSVEGVS